MIRENPSSDGLLKRLGVLDFFPAGTYNGQFEDAAFALKTGEVSELVDTAGRFELIKLLERKPEVVTPLSEVKDTIKGQLTGLKRTETIKKLLEDGKKKYNAEVKISIK